MADVGTQLNELRGRIERLDENNTNMEITRRDYFAARALAAMIIAYPEDEIPSVAGASYQYADAMIAEAAKHD